MDKSLWNVITGAVHLWPLDHLVLFFVGCAVVFGTLEYLFPANKNGEFRRAGVLLDLTYWFVTPVLIKITTSLFLVFTAGVMFYVIGRPLDEHVLDGFGPLSRQPEWLQILEVLVITDFVGYWSHRWFHVTRMWKFHAVHHSPSRLDWLSANRMHPVNDGLSRVFQSIPVLLLGFSPRIVEPYIIIIVVYVVFLHSNVRWTWGPLRYVLASPTFHRWHHSSEPEALDMNYAIMFPIWDVMFGTWHIPDRQPVRYGVKDGSVPESLVGQMVYPFVYKPPEIAETAAVHAEPAPQASACP
jgi:sterol desaturase/sphingolipid hydroxylase (fatty acid hydroxylase superfamily)